MSVTDSRLRLELLVAVCQQLPEAEADEMMWLAIDDPLRFTSAMLDAHEAQRIRLSAAHVRLLHRDLVVRSSRNSRRSAPEGLANS